MVHVFEEYFSSYCIANVGIKPLKNNRVQFFLYSVLLINCVVMIDDSFLEWIFDFDRKSKAGYVMNVNTERC